MEPLRDIQGRPYEPAVSPALKWLLAFIFAGAAVLGATGVYLGSISLLEKAQDAISTNAFTLWMYLVHVLVGILLVLPFLIFGVRHWAGARHRPNRRAVRLGKGLFLTSLVVGFTGIALIQLEMSVTAYDLTLRLPQMPTGTVARSVTYALHVAAPPLAVLLYVFHRRAGPAIQWKWGVGWGVAVAGFVLIMAVMHSQDPRRWYAQGSPEGEKYFEPSKTRTVDGKFIPADALMMDHYCLRCHPDTYKDFFHSAHHFSSFNNPAYLFSVRETRQVALARDGEVRASRWCAGCHDPVPLLSGQFDNPHFDDVRHATAQAGITCTVCHAMVNVNSRRGNGDYTIEEPQHYPFAYSDHPALQWLNNQIVKAKPDFHKKTFLKPFHKSEAFCFICHKVSLPIALNHYKEFLRGQNHADTYYLSGVSGHGARSFYYPPEAKTNCAECHMPLQASADFGSRDFDGSGVRKIHSHRFPAANTGLPWLLSLDPQHQAHQESLRNAAQVHADFLAGQQLRIDLFGLKRGGTIDGPLIAPLRPRLPDLEPGKTYLVEVVIRSLAVGHPFTQGTADSNEVWVDFLARSGARVIGHSGALDGQDQGRVDEWAHFVNVLMLDRDGNRIDRRNPQDIFTPLYNHQIPPGAAQVVHYQLTVPADLTAPVELEVRLRYRKFDYTYMEKVYGAGKVPKLPIVDLCADHLTLPVAGVPAAAQVSPIEPPWQRWNDYGIGCFLEGGADAKKGELRQAEQAFQQLLAENTREAHAHGYLNLGRVYLAEGRLEEAADVLNKAQTAEPAAPWWTVAWLNGLVNAQNGHLDEAIANFETILDPAKQPRRRKFDFTTDYVVINELGKTLFARSQLERDNPVERNRLLQRAVAHLERTLTIDPEDLDAHYWLAKCYARLGEDLTVEAIKPPGKPAEKDLLTLGEAFADGKHPQRERLRAAAQLGGVIEAYGDGPSDPHHPRLPLLNRLTRQCLSVYRQEKDVDLQRAAAWVLGHLHLQIHALYKPDNNAQDRVIALYRQAHPAAAAASFPIVIYRTLPQ
jgi:tetratricopeptide (TPR) repeat protein